MNEVVSPAYTLTVYRTAEVHVKEEPLHRIIEQLLSLARLNSKGAYIFKVLKFYSSHQAKTLEFEHSGTDSVYLYHCRIGNIAGMTGIFQAVLRIPDNSGFHSGITAELNAAAVKLLAEIQAAPPEPPPRAEALTPKVPSPNLRLVTPTEPRKEAVLLSTSTGTLPTQKKIVGTRPAPAASQPKKLTKPEQKQPKPKRPRFKPDAELRMKLTKLKQRVLAKYTERLKHLKRVETDVALIQALLRDLEKLDATLLHQAEVRERLKKFK
jgi:hypothetical protein